MKKAEGLLKEAEQKKAELSREADKIKADAEQEATAMIDKGQRDLDVLVRRREDINAEISRVQDVLEALESFEAPSGGGGKTASNSGSAAGGVKAGAAAGATRSGGKGSEG